LFRASEPVNQPEPERCNVATDYTCYLTHDDATVLRRVGFEAASPGVVVWANDALNEVLYLLDRAAEAGDAAACTLAGTLLATGEPVEVTHA
jgi:TPR repeat protein